MEQTETIKQQSSIEVSKNSRGVTYTVKAYGDNSTEIEKTLQELLRIAQTEESKLL